MSRSQRSSYEKVVKIKTDQLRDFPAPWGEFGNRFTQSFETLKCSRDFHLANGLDETVVVLGLNKKAQVLINSSRDSYGKFKKK